MAPSGAGKVKATTALLIAPNATWWVTAVAADGSEFDTDPITVASPC